MRQIDITDAKSGDCKACGGYGSGIFGQPCLACLAPRATYMSFGGGVQSTAIAELVIRRDPRLLAVAPDLPELFIFADTGDEPEAVYAHVEMMRERIEAAGFRWLTVCKGGRLGDTAAAGRVDIPVWTDTDDPDAKRRPMRRACTVDWKAAVMDREAKARYGVNLRRKKQPEGVVACWQGISTDEAQRTRISQDQWRSFCYPLLSMRWSRLDCLAYLASINMTAPKSACVFCPFHGDEVWRSLSPADMARAVEVEDAMHAHVAAGTGYASRLRSLPTLHRSGIPLRERPFDRGEDSGAMDNECAGICGV
jgi:hypothetical protein